MIEVKKGSSGSEESLGKYDYNADGLRIRHYNGDRGNVDYYYDDNAVIEEHNANDGSLLAHYRYADRLISLETSTSVQYYHHDSLGSTVNLTDQTGSVIVAYWLDPWGQIRNQTGDSVNRQIFTGQEHDLKTGLIYFGARYYDPDTARFITEDTYLGDQGTPPSLDRYLYAYSNPSVYTDLEGYYSVEDEEYKTGKGISETVAYEKGLAEAAAEQAAQERTESYQDERKYKYQYAWMTREDTTGKKSIADLKISEKGKEALFKTEGGHLKESDKLYWPKGASGPTLGAGFDIGTRKEKDKSKIIEILENLGIDKDTSEALAEGVGKRGEDAEKFVKDFNKQYKESHSGQDFKLTKEQKLDLLDYVLEEGGYEDLVRKYVKTPQKQHEYDALVSFAYNPGGEIKEGCGCY